MKLCDVKLCDVKLCDVKQCDVKLCDVNLCDVKLCDVKLCDVKLLCVKKKKRGSAEAEVRRREGASLKTRTPYNNVGNFPKLGQNKAKKECQSVRRQPV